MIYLASPYSGTKEQQEARYREAMSACAALFNKGLFPVSPIVHWHEIALRYKKLRTDADSYRAYNHSLLTVCSSLYILQIPGWKESKGVQMEIEWANALKKPKKLIVPDYKTYLICDWNK